MTPETREARIHQLRVADLTRRRFLGLTALAIAGTGLAACGASGTASPSGAAASASGRKVASKVRATFFPEPSDYVVAKATGWFDDTSGTPYEWTQVENGPEILTLMANNGVDLGFGIGARPLASGVPNGVPFRVVGLIAEALGINGLVARPGTGITDAKSLTGKKVGLPFGSNMQLVFSAWLKLSDMTEADIELLDLNDEAILAAWQRNDIDAAVEIGATLAKLLETGEEVESFIPDLRAAGWAVYDQIIATDQFVTSYPDSVADALRTVQRAYDYWQSSFDDAAGVLAEELGYDAEVAKEQMKAFNLLAISAQTGPEYLGTKDAPGGYGQSMRNLADAMVGLGLIPAAATIEEYAARVAYEPIQAAIAEPWQG